MSKSLKVALAYTALAALCCLAFAPALWNGFVYFDDDAYITENPYVASGVTPSSLSWALSGVRNANWHPLTWWSHMLDVSVFGMQAWGHHLHNILLHAANSCLLLALLRAWGIGFWPALLAAAFWAVHPLRVESVAWAAERKDLLCTLFGLLSLLAYDRHARARGLSWLGAAVLCLGAGLMAKPMLVTIPCVMLVLDALVYRRLNALALLEKLPLFVLVGGSVAITLWAQRGAMQPPELLSLGQRMLLAVLGTATYLRDTALPGAFQALTPLYPLHADSLSPWMGVACGVLLLLITGGMLAVRSSRLPLAGWLIFLGTLVPVSGLMQVGNQSHADRYTYLPAIGLALAMGCLLERGRGPVARATMIIAVGLLLVLTMRQTMLWRNTETLFTHTLAHTRDNSVAHNNLGRFLLEEGRNAEALGHLEEAVHLAPANPEARFNLGSAYLLINEPRKAISLLAPLMPFYLQDGNFYLNLALAMRQTGDPQFSVVANNALLLLPADHPARQTLLDALK